MRKAHLVPIQYLIGNGIGARLINAASRQRMRSAKEPVSDHLAHRVLTGDMYEDTVSLGVSALLGHVMRHLNTDPIRVMPSVGSRLRIRVFGALDYVIDRSERVVWVEPSPISPREKASKQSPPWKRNVDSRVDNVDLLNPLCKSTWLVYIAARPGWFSYTQKPGEQNQGQLFTSLDAMDSALNEVVVLGDAHHHGHGEHTHGGHDHRSHQHNEHHQDLNLKSAYVHVVADAATSVLAILALMGGWLYGWAWLNLAIGILGAVVVALWAKRLIADTGKVLLDREMDHPVVDEIREAIEEGGKSSETTLTDLHVWRVGKSAYSCALSVVTHDSKLTPDTVRNWWSQHEEIVHATVEIHYCLDAHTA